MKNKPWGIPAWAIRKYPALKQSTNYWVFISMTVEHEWKKAQMALARQKWDNLHNPKFMRPEHFLVEVKQPDGIWKQT